MKNNILILICVLLGVIAVGLLILQIPKESRDPVACTMEAFVCPDGSTVGRTGPNCEFAPCPQVVDETEEPSEDTLIVVDYPQEGETITSPVTISGEARGNWFFEATFPIVIVNWDGLIIGEGYATAEGDWMTTAFVPFTATVSYTLPPETPYARGAVILQKANASGLPEHDAAIEIPVTFSEITE